MGDGFLVNELHFFLECLPSITIIFAILVICFKVTKQWTFSKLIKKYDFYAIYIAMIFEGNVEELTFFGVG